MRGLIFGIAALCFAAALAIAGAGMRLTAPQPGGSLVVAPPTTPQPEQTLASQPEQTPPTAGQSPRTTTDAPGRAPEAPQLVPAASSAPSPVASQQSSSGQLQTTVADLAREQAASRELVTALRTTVAQLQQELARQSASLQAGEPQGRTLAVLCCDLLPPGHETLGAGAAAAVRSVVPEIKVDARHVVSVEGHSDSRPIRIPGGKPFKDNADLSLLRARSVASLLQKYGVEAGRIRVKGWGDTRPLTSNDTAEGRDRNRRVEIRLIPPSMQP